MNAVQVIEPREPRLMKWQVGTFDIETKPIASENPLLSPYCLGATCLDDKGDTVQYHWKAVDLLSYMLRHKDKVRWFCHNGGGFDFKYLICDDECKQYISTHGYRVDVIGGSIAKALMFKKGKKVTLLCDSFKIMPASLAKLTKDLGAKTAKGFIDFEKENFDEYNSDHLQYLADDCIGLYQVVTKYRSIINTEFGTEIKCTASSTAFACWSTLLKDPVFHHSQKTNAFARLSYYGGRTECFCQTSQKDVSYIDVNSLYAFIMYEYGGLHRAFYTREYSGAGFYRVNADVPLSAKFGPLAYRKADKTGVCFPVGSFETYASNLEIDTALEMGCKVEVIEGYAFDEWDKDLFKPFITKCMELRQRDYNGALGLTAKFLQNNLYGFFGMNPLRGEIVFSERIPDEDGFAPVIDEETGLQIWGLWERQVIKETLNCIPTFAAWITSAARVHLLKAMLAEEAAGNTVLYCDTDSIILKGEPVSRISEGEYGAFKLEGKFDEFTGITAKTYVYTVNNKMSVEEYSRITPQQLKALKRKGITFDAEGTQYTMKCKGIPADKLTPDMYLSALQGVGISREFVQLNSLSRVMRTGVLGNERATRSMPTVASITTRVPAEGGYTKPIKIVR